MVKELQLGNKGVSLVDDDVYDDVVRFSWCLTRHRDGKLFYARGRVGQDRRKTLLHRYILKPPPEVLIDHVNKNGLDNRKENLRLVTPSQNSQNKRVKVTNLSGYKGVHYDKTKNKWRVMIQVDGQARHVGKFDCPVKAAIVYDTEARKHFGEFACLNFPEPHEQGCR